MLILTNDHEIFNQLVTELEQYIDSALEDVSENPERLEVAQQVLSQKLSSFVKEDRKMNITFSSTEVGAILEVFKWWIGEFEVYGALQKYVAELARVLITAMDETDITVYGDEIDFLLTLSILRDHANNVESEILADLMVAHLIDKIAFSVRSHTELKHGPFDFTNQEN